MAKSEQQKQKKLAKKKAKEQRKKRELARQQQLMTSMAGKMQAAANGEIKDCLISDSLFEGNDESAAIGHVMLSRVAPGGHIAMAFFLVDLGCMGVKDVAGNYRTPTEYSDVMTDMRNRRAMQPCSPEFARGVVEASIGFAESCGLAPHPDYVKYAPLWNDIEPISVENKITFGANGRPVYIAGPFDNDARQALIFNRMSNALGAGNFHFVAVPEQQQKLLEEDFSDEPTMNRIDSAE
ncbi:hypothetical protein [Rhodopirellula halodulae]|uniref:hypothetical protein n=1 Tax=Rhodopirellula halodulae TaxID=2894198 RepID=UPI001E2C73E6|nr:hypothetical protein [Rhodopirellula sp. JC737]MCC9656995.1 hypothetical protein [Rhodopirellula sp. JC737]